MKLTRRRSNMPFFVLLLLLLSMVVLSLVAVHSFTITSYKYSSSPPTRQPLLSTSTTTRFVVRVNQDEASDFLDELFESDDDDDNDDDDVVISSVPVAEDCSDAVLYNEYDDDDDDEDASCIPPGRRGRMNPQDMKMIFAISDSTGSTLKSAIQKCLVQFGSSCDGERYKSNEDCNVQVRTFTFIRGEEILSQLVKAASDKHAFVMFTIADPTLRAQTLRMCELSYPNIPGAIDLLGPSIDLLATFLQKDPIGRAMPDVVVSSSSSSPQDQSQSPTPSRRVELSDSYYKRIDAVEFTLQADDGKAPWLLKDADVIIVGVSRTGKTPLSVVLSQSMGLKVANIPLVLEVPPPKELLLVSTSSSDGNDSESNGIDPGRVFCLTLAPSELKRIRTTRLERRNAIVPPSNSTTTTFKTSTTAIAGTRTTTTTSLRREESSSSSSNYNDRAYVMNDLRNARELSSKYGWTQIDVTGRAVEETASFISEILNERYGEEISSLL